jgi:hypothetical protein
MEKETPASLANKHLRWRIKSDLDQVKWRMDYLNKLI